MTAARRRSVTAVFVWALLSCAATAWAQADPDEALYQRAHEIRDGDQAGALAIYQDIHNRTRSPRAAAQIGTLEAQMGRWMAADEHLSAALAAQGDAWVEPRRAALEVNLQSVRSHLSALKVVADAPGARLRVNGVEAGALPLREPVRVAVGSLVIDVEAEGYEPARQRVEATPGSTRVEVTLVRRVVAPPPPPPVVITRVVTATEPPREPPRALLLQRALGVAALALGGVGVGVGAVAVALRNSNVAAFTERYCYVGPDGVPSGPVSAGCQSEYDSGVTMERLSVASFITAGALTVTGVLLLIVQPGASNDRRSAVSCGVGLGSLECVGRF